MRQKALQLKKKFDYLTSRNAAVQDDYFRQKQAYCTKVAMNHCTSHNVNSNSIAWSAKHHPEGHRQSCMVVLQATSCQKGNAGQHWCQVKDDTGMAENNGAIYNIVIFFTQHGIISKQDIINSIKHGSPE